MLSRRSRIVTSRKVSVMPGVSRADHRRMIDMYQRHMRARGLMPSTIEARMRVLARFETYLGRPIETGTLDELRDWLDNHSKQAARTRYGLVSHLACFYRWAVIEGFLEVDPTMRLERPKLRRGLPRPVATSDVALAIAQAPSAEVRALVTLASFAGLRCGEIAGLDRADILDRRDPPVIHVVHAKGGRERVVPAHPAVLEALGLLPLPIAGPLFVDSLGSRRPSHWVTHTLRNHLHACGISASGHQLRHWFATSVYESSSDLRLTQELLGHASPTTTAVYTAISQLRASAVVGDLDAA